MLGTNDARRMPAEPMLLSLREVAVKLCIAVPTLRRWLREKKLAHVRCGRAVRVESAEVRRFIAQNRCPARDEQKVDIRLSTAVVRPNRSTQGSH
jgi:excisionase family DNA binding protein